MKTLGHIMGALLVCGALTARAAQDTDITPREVRDPLQLETWLETNASDAQSRVASLETSIGTNVAAAAVTVGSLSTTGAVTISAGKLADGVITNDDIAATAAIAVTKLGTGAIIPANSGASLTNIPVTALQAGGLIPANSAASLTNIPAAQVNGDLAVDDAAVDSLEDDSVAAAVAVTNGGSYQLSGLIAQLNSSGALTGATNAITLLALDATDEGAVIFVVNTGTNAISIAKTGTWAGNALVIEELGGSTIVATASNVFYAVGHNPVE